MKKLRRKPTYGAAIRLARIASELFSKPYGWSFEAIENNLEISARTLARYVSVLRSDLLDSRGNPIVEVVGVENFEFGIGSRENFREIAPQEREFKIRRDSD